MDFIIDFSSSSGNIVILTTVGRFSRMVHLVPLRKLLSSKGLDELIVKEVFHLYGLPVDIVSDHVPQFISQFWKKFCNLLGISVSLSSVFYSKSDG